MRIGIYGGSFNPVHIGHLFLAEGALEALSLDKIIWVPASVPPHRRLPGGVSAEQRYLMVRLAVKSNPAFEVSRVEMERSGPSYTVDTVRHLQARSDKKAVWYFLLGTDAAAELSSWRDIRSLRKIVRFAAVQRPGEDSRRASGVQMIPVKTVSVSASEIRRRVKRGESIRYLVPDPVRKYILSKGLYR